MRLEFTVRDPLGTNSAYGRGNGRRLYMRAAGKAYKDRVANAAFAAKVHSGWPNLDDLVCVEVGYQLWNYRGDTDGVAKITRDALEGILYHNDRICQDGPHPLPRKDKGGKRIEITVTVIQTKEKK